jgi:protein-L-isoaspartate(D-aspartate) O-methyltransferase
MNKDDLLKYLEPFVADLERQGSLQSQWLKDALLRVPRHLFIDRYYEPEPVPHFVAVDPQCPTEQQLAAIYSDRGLMIREPPNHSAASQPSLVIDMLEALEVARGQKVLEVGTGSGWNAALLAFGVGDDRLVYSIDIQPDLIEPARQHLSAAGFPNVNLTAADGGYGWLEAAPFDRIIVTASSGDIPPAWIEQLADGGVLVLPLKTAGIGDPVLRLRKDGQRVAGQFTRWCYFVPLVGAFLNGEQEGLLPPWEPFIEELRRREPTKVPIAESVDRDCVFLAYLTTGLVRGTQPLRVRPGPLPGSYAADLAVFDPQSRSICVALSEEPAVEVYGDLGGAERLAITQQEWIALGRPKITDYKVELVDPARAAEEHGVWIDRRPHATLKFSLPTR